MGSNKQIYIYIIGTALGMRYLHDVKNVAHRDLKPSNVFLDSNFYPKIADFGLSRIQDSSFSSFCGTPGFIAPEVLMAGSDHKYDGKKADVFSFGTFLYSILFDQYPFPDLQPHIKDLKILNGERPDIPQDIISKSMENLIQKCWKENPNERPTFAEIIDDLLSRKVKIQDQGNIDRDAIDNYLIYCNERPIFKKDDPFFKGIQLYEDHNSEEAITYFSEV